jgi:hypothetical protein
MSHVGGERGSYKKAVITVLVQKKHAGLERNHDLFSRRSAVSWVEDGLASNAALGR